LRIRETSKNAAIQRDIRNRANYSSALLGGSFVWRESGRYVNLFPSEEETVRTTKGSQSIENRF